MLLDLRYYDDPILREKCEEIGEITAEIKQLAQDMIETMMLDNRGSGLAAPQVGHTSRIFVTAMTTVNEDDEVVYERPYVFINPILSDPSEETVAHQEGCLSIPKLFVYVNRPKEITCEYTDVDGKRHKERFEGWFARAIMHENDHLNGVLHIDRTTRRERNEIQGDLRRIKKKFAKKT